MRELASPPAFARRRTLRPEEIEEGEEPPRPIHRNFLGLLGVFQFLVAVSAIARVFGRVLMTHFAVARFAFPFF